MQIRGTGKQLERRRLYAVARIVDGGITQAALSRELKLSTKTIEKWMALYRAGGEAALKSQPRPGRPRFMTPSEHRELRRMLIEGPRRHGFDTDLWTCPRVADVIEKKIKHWVEHDWELVKKSA